MANVIYKVHPRHSGVQQLITYVNGKTVNLLGRSVTRVHAATETTSQWTEQIAGATQADLKAVHERGDRDRDNFMLVIAEPMPSKMEASEKK
ncbi:hypothetical protein KC887_00685 [Candidatus Kaiserbacteria bacterium]|nr:hypothetical protein [Candidatus Kaiserbacteria bacterium]